MKIGLVLEGGGMRGAYTAGCLKWLIEQNLYFDHACAISATAVFLEYYITKDVVSLEKLGRGLMCDKNNIGILPILKERTILGYNYIFDQILKKITPLSVEKIKQSKTLAEIGVYDLKSDSLVWIDNQTFDEDLQFLRASCILPLAGKTVSINDRKYMDGGVLSMLPIFHSEQAGNDKFFCITTKHKSYVRKPNGWLVAKLLKLVYGKEYPKLVKNANDDRVDIYNRELDEVERLVDLKKAIFMRPSTLSQVSRLRATEQELSGLFDRGYLDCEARKSEILDFFKVNV